MEHVKPEGFPMIDFEKQSRDMAETEEQRIRAGIRELIQQCHGNAVRKKWWDPAPTFGEALMLTVSELSEALEAFRDGLAHGTIVWHDEQPGKPSKPEGIPVELADVVIRVCDLCGGFGVPLDEAIIQKILYNRTRPERHGGKKL